MDTFQDYNYALSLTSQFYFCGIPFRLDTSPKCTLNCSYCFASSRSGRRTQLNLIVNPDRIRKYLERINYSNSLNAELLSSRLPIHFGGMSDPFSWSLQPFQWLDNIIQ